MLAAKADSQRSTIFHAEKRKGNAIHGVAFFI